MAVKEEAVSPHEAVLDLNANLVSGCRGDLRSRYILGPALGRRGSWGHVFLARDKVTELTRAVRVVRLSRMQRVDPVELGNILNLPSHPNIVAYHTHFLSDKEMALAMTLCVCSVIELFPLTLGQIDFVVGEVMTGLTFLHQEGIVHGTLRASSILLDHKGLVKLSDVGLVKVMGNELTVRAWEAPEVRSRIVFTRSSDVWDLGVLIVELVKEGRLPYRHYRAGPDSLLSLLYPGSLSDGCKQVAICCLQEEPGLRPRIDQLVTKLERRSDPGQGMNMVKVIAGSNSDLIVKFVQDVNAKKVFLECSKCYVLTSYSPVFLTMQEEDFICDACLEGEHEFCQKGEEICRQCQFYTFLVPGGEEAAQKQVEQAGGHRETQERRCH